MCLALEAAARESDMAHRDGKNDSEDDQRREDFDEGEAVPRAIATVSGSDDVLACLRRCNASRESIAEYRARRQTGMSAPPEDCSACSYTLLRRVAIDAETFAGDRHVTSIDAMSSETGGRRHRSAARVKLDEVNLLRRLRRRHLHLHALGRLQTRGRNPSRH